jgi:hypothetical protein
MIFVSSDPLQWKIESRWIINVRFGDLQRWIPYDRSHRQSITATSKRFCGSQKRTMARGTAKRESDSSYGSNGIRIYVSRRCCSTRYVINDDELLVAHNEYGFESYVLVYLSFRDQVKLFSNAKVVIGPHGAGFTYTIFADYITLIKLFGSSRLSHSLCYYGIAIT